MSSIYIKFRGNQHDTKDSGVGYSLCSSVMWTNFCFCNCTVIAKTKKNNNNTANKYLQLKIQQQDTNIPNILSKIEM